MTSRTPMTEETPAVYLHPGEIHTTSEAALVSTILGSCVSVCLWDAVASVAGMNHFLLPEGTRTPRYGREAMERLLEDMVGRGALVARMVAKVFGGACVIPGFTGASRAIGTKNVEVALEFLARHGIPVRVNQTGGARGRKLLFHTGTGSAYVKEL